MIYLFLLPSTIYSFLLFDPLLYYTNFSEADSAGVILSQSQDSPSLWEMVKNETMVEGNSTWLGREFDETSGSLSLNTIGVIKRNRRDGNESDSLLLEWNNLLKVLNISDSTIDSISANDLKEESEIPSKDIFSRHWRLDRF